MAKRENSKINMRIHESYWPGGELESILDKRHNAIFLINGTHKLLNKVFQGLELARYTRNMRPAADYFRAGYLYLNKIVRVYVNERKGIVCFERPDAFTSACKYREVSNKLIQRLQEHMAICRNPKKLDAFCTRLLRVTKYFDKGLGFYPVADQEKQH